MKSIEQFLMTQREVKSKSGFQENRRRISEYELYPQQIPATYSYLVSILNSVDVGDDNVIPKALRFKSGCVFRNCVVVSD